MIEPHIFISQCTRAVPADLVARERTLIITLDEANFHFVGQIFHLQTDGFLFMASIFEGHIRLHRNDHEVDLPVINGPQGLQWITIFLGWSPEKLEVAYGIIPSRSAEPDAQRELQTPYSVAPPALVRWLRKQNLLEVITYSSESDFRNKVSSILITLQDTIDAMASENGFWDIEYDRNRIASRKPKRETDMHSLMHAFFLDQFLMSSIEVLPEHTMGAGRLDFLLVATVSGIGMVKICLEVKLAHSEDLIAGLIKQLPIYMDSAGAQDGIYLVLWYGTPAAHDEVGSLAEMQTALTDAQLLYHERRMCARIRVHCLDLTRSPKASRQHAGHLRR